MGLQHTPVVSERDETSIMSHNALPELLKKLSLQRLCKIISDHLFRWQIFNHDIALLHLVCNEELMNVNCSGPLARALLTVVFQKNSALVVLIKNVLLDLVALGLQKQFGPKNGSGTVIHSDQFGLSAAASVELLLQGLVNGKPRP